MTHPGRIAAERYAEDCYSKGICPSCGHRISLSRDPFTKDKRATCSTCGYTAIRKLIQ